jgi:hypothetical protein
MVESSRPETALSFEQLVALRGHTEAIAQFLRTQLQDHVETLRPLFAPRRLLGKYVGVKETVVGADRAFTQLQEQYRQVCGKPFGLPPELDEDALSVVDNRLELYAWEYAHEAKSTRETKTITITSPVCWLLTYSSGYTLTQLRHALLAPTERRPDHLRQFVVNALLMAAVLARYPGLVQLFTDLRYQVHIDRAADFGALPLVTIRSCLSSFRPPDDLILAATRLSGVAAFIELIDMDGVHALPDPLKLRLEDMLR